MVLGCGPSLLMSKGGHFVILLAAFPPLPDDCPPFGLACVKIEAVTRKLEARLSFVSLGS